MLSIPLLGDAGRPPGRLRQAVGMLNDSRVAAVQVESSSSSGEPLALCGLMADF
jgi:hypothetical protein